MTDPAIDTAAMPASFRARLDAALARPVLLAPAAVDAARTAGSFRPQRPAQDGVMPYMLHGDVAEVRVDGAIAQRAWSCWTLEGEGYDGIEARVRAALADPKCAGVVLRIDSPGGEVAGCAECAKALRAAADAAGKPLVAFADEMACSAAYWLACAADAIVVPETGCVGSVGVLAVLTDRSGANATTGRTVRVVRSGARKAVPHPDEPLTDAAAALVQGEVDALADVFISAVAARRGLDTAKVRALEGGTLLGPSAQEAGLADEVGNFNAAISRARALAAPSKAHAMTANTNKALGLAPDASDADALSAIHDLRTRVAALEALTGQTGPEALGVIHAWKASHGRVEAVERELAAQAKAREAQERAGLLDGAVADGKLSPAERSAYDTRAELRDLPLAAVRAIVATMPARVAVASVVTGPVPGAAAGLTAEELAMGRTFGLTPAEVAASKAALAAHRARAGRSDRDAE